jgi:hypothetical protein
MSKKNKTKNKKIEKFKKFEKKGGSIAETNGKKQRNEENVAYSHYNAVCSRAHLAHELPSLLEVESLVERFDAMVSTVRERIIAAA